MRLVPRSLISVTKSDEQGGAECSTGLDWVERFQPERPQQPLDFRRLSRRDYNPRTT